MGERYGRIAAIGMLCLPLVVAVFEVPARSQPRPRTPSADAFSACREQEKIGDARACWALWLQKFRATGSEAETAYAEEHTKGLTVPAPTGSGGAPSAAGSSSPASGGPASVTLTAYFPAIVLVDGRKVGLTPVTHFTVSPGDHVAVFQRLDNRGIVKATKAFTAASGETISVEAKAEEFQPASESPPPETPPPAASELARDIADKPTPTEKSPTPPAPVATVAASTGYAPGDVLDLCALEPKKDATKFEKQRVVVFAPSGTEQINDDAKVRQVQGARLVRDIFTARLPLQRFNNVVTELPAKKDWTSSETLSLSDIDSYVKAPADQGDASRTARLDDERKFVAYSLACTDYLVAPGITTHETKWENVKVKTKQGEKTVKTLSVKMGGKLAIFKRDGTSFQRVALIESSVPGLADSLSDAAAAATSVADIKVGGVDLMSAAMKVSDLPSYISAVPDPTCLAGKIGKEGVEALLACSKGQGTAEQALGNLDERLGSVCRNSRSKPEDQGLAVECEVRARAFQLARAFQKQARSVEGWQLFGVLAITDDHGPSFSLGRDEGVGVGYGFQVRDASGERLAYYKVTSVGAGGDDGDSEPTLLSRRSGTASAGARLEEYPQLGLVITAFGSIGLLSNSNASTTVQAGGQSAQFVMPTFVFGGGADFGWDLSGLVGWTETFGRVDVGVLTGTGSGTQCCSSPSTSGSRKAST